MKMNIFKFEFKRNLKSLIYWSVGTSLIIIFFMVFFPSMQNSGMQEIAAAKFDALPKEMLEAFNISSVAQLTTLTGYLGYCVQFIAMACAIYGILLGIPVTIEEESEGTIEFLYSKPVSRSKILWSKIGQKIVTLLIFISIITIATMTVSVAVKPEDVKTMELLMDIKLIYVGVFLVSLIFMAIGILISTLLKRNKGAVSMAFGIFFITYIVGIVSKLKENLNFMKYFSPYEWVVPSEIINNGFDFKYIALGFVVIIISLGAATLIYKKKDLYIN